MTGRSPAQHLAALPEAERVAWLREKGEVQVRQLLRSWRYWARPEQLAPPGDWDWWGVKAGRGFGKGRTGAEWVADRCEAFAEADAEHLLGLGNLTFGEVRSLQIEGVSGLKVIAARRGHSVEHATTAREARYLIPRYGRRPHESRIELHTSVEPNLARGRNFHTLWLDEFGSWRNVKDELGGTTFTNLDLGLRAVGPLRPQGIATFTPRFVPWVVDFLAGKHGTVVLTEGSTFDNKANLAPAFVRKVLERYAHSPLGAQEIFGQMVESVEGALWNPAAFNRSRVTRAQVPPLRVVSIGVDPPGEAWGAEAGIIGCGLGPAPEGVTCPRNPCVHLYVIGDWSIGEATADDWPPRVVLAYDEAEADRIAAEVNHGGDMVRRVIQVERPGVPVKKVRASRGKYVRAEPVARLWTADHSRAHVVDFLPLMEAQCNTWRPGDDSPDRMDALAWAANDLLPDLLASGKVGAYGSQVANTSVR